MNRTFLKLEKPTKKLSRIFKIQIVYDENYVENIQKKKLNLKRVSPTESTTFHAAS